METKVQNFNKAHDKTIEKGLVGIFGNRADAEAGFEIIHKRGYNKEDINLLMSNEAKSLFFNETKLEGDPVFNEGDIVKETDLKKVTNNVVKDAAIGAGIGATVGAVLGAVAAIGTSVIIPGAGLVVAGPLASGLISATGLAFGGGMIGTIFGFEIPDSHTTIEGEIQKNKILIGIHPSSKEEADEITKAWRTIPGVRVLTE